VSSFLIGMLDAQVDFGRAPNRYIVLGAGRAYLLEQKLGSSYALVFHLSS
jgi:hypothetical protein